MISAVAMALTGHGKMVLAGQAQWRYLLSGISCLAIYQDLPLKGCPCRGGCAICFAGENKLPKMNWKKLTFNFSLWLVLLVAGHWFVHAYHEILTERFSLAVSLISQVGLIFLLITILSLLVLRKSQPLGHYPLLVIWIAMIIIAHNLVFIENMTREDTLAALNMNQGWPDLIWVTAVYALILAIPFMPGLELGLIIMALFGAKGIVAAYLGTILGLCSAYVVGRRLAGLSFGKLVAVRWANWARLERFMGPGFTAFIEKYRYVLLGLAFNLPGNSALGGGGGISLMSGMSGLFALPKFFLTAVIATAPLPILIFLGFISIESLRFSS
ncbi:MAG: hypothetical protein HQ502_16135 [Alphaproteobacteria bacterium]|nr:hypothetical protein [Alphaproteobacteria bacterium]